MITSFDPDFVPAFAEEVIAAYARIPIPECRWPDFAKISTAAGFSPDVNGQSRRAWKSQVMWLPRASAAYQVNDGMVAQRRLWRVLRLPERHGDYAAINLASAR